MKALVVLLFTASAVAQIAEPRPTDPLRDGFVNPPQSARPLVWWHWMNGNISKEGIRADLTWMHDAGLGGVQVFDAALSTPQIVQINGQNLGTVWHTPFRLDATPALHAGTNTLTSTVANAWVNRLIGDQQPGATKYTHTDITPYHADSPLLPSGLLGPVRLFRTMGR